MKSALMLALYAEKEMDMEEVCNKLGHEAYKRW